MESYIFKGYFFSHGFINLEFNWTMLFSQRHVFACFRDGPVFLESSKDLDEPPKAVGRIRRPVLRVELQLAPVSNAE